MFANGVLEQRVKLFLGRFEREILIHAKGQSPVRAGGNFAVNPFQPFAGRKFFDAFDERPRAGHVIQRKVAIEALQTEAAVDFRVDKDALQLRTEEKIFTLAGDVQGFDTHAVAGEDQASRGFLPEGNREHAAELRETIFIPLHKGAKNGFRVRMGVEAVA